MSSGNRIADLLADMRRAADFIPRGFSQPYVTSIRDLDEIEAGHTGKIDGLLFTLRWDGDGAATRRD